MSDEKWMPVKGYEGLYEISTEGRLTSFHWKERHLIKNGPNTAGYRQNILFRDGIGRARTIHRMVAEAFLGDIVGMEINHKNGDKCDNRVENLEIVTRSENILHRIHVLKRSIGQKYKGSEHYNARLTEEKVIAIRTQHASGISRLALARKFGVSKSTIIHVVKRHNWTHV